jgi:hypothetical protein
MRLFIPTPPQNYDQGTFNTILDTVKRSLIPVISAEEAVAGVLLQSPDGSVYKLTVDNAGNLVTTAVPLGSR